MTRRPLAGTMYLRSLAFALTALLAAPNVEAQNCKPHWWTRSCLIAMGIYAAAFLVVLGVLVGGIYISDKRLKWRKRWADWRNNRRIKTRTTAAEERAPLSESSRTKPIFDNEIGAAEEGKVIAHTTGDGDYLIMLPPLRAHLSNSSQMSLSATSSMSGLPSYAEARQ
ncbi:hypothetical protein BJ322DRAFT_878656 [Thelephora terrestris]|uniref:Uncharacterized protein n=1 Tax=Thelephora terrestris TaxID=56493 RepID=A0A9P6L550_9AGAM|nr:hypothetical protein BJ322DRAFT_878656 [Thelephora terrestris]